MLGRKGPRHVFERWHAHRWCRAVQAAGGGGGALQMGEAWGLHSHAPSDSRGSSAHVRGPGPRTESRWPRGSACQQDRVRNPRDRPRSPDPPDAFLTCMASRTPKGRAGPGRAHLRSTHRPTPPRRSGDGGDGRGHDLLQVTAHHPCPPASASAGRRHPSGMWATPHGPAHRLPVAAAKRNCARQTCHEHLAGKLVLIGNRPRTQGPSVIPAPQHHQNSVGTCCVECVAQ